MIKKLAKAFAIFFHPKSPAAVYHNPRRLLYHVLTYSLNFYLKTIDTIRPSNRVKCNICGWTGHKFGYTAASSVDYFGADEICFRCHTNQRTRTLVSVLTKNINLTSDHLTIADIGAVPGTRKFFAGYPNIKYLTIDRYKDADINCDITDIQLADNSVEVILCCHVLEHIDNYSKGIEELFRILKPGHYGIIVVPQTPGLKISRRISGHTFLGYGHIWEFGDDFAEQLIAAGFQVSTVNVEEKKQSGTVPYHIILKPYVDAG